jgi:cupin superfamily acireductone dioxygenase involved in methionine salvage
MHAAVTNTTTDKPAQEDSTKPAEENSTKSAKSKGISFGEVRVREHERVLNTRSSARYADLTLGWAHHGSKHYVIDDFEKLKEEEHHEKKRHKHYERVQVLSKYGYSPKDVITLEEDKKKVMEKREKGIIAEESEYIEPKRGGIIGFFRGWG